VKPNPFSMLRQLVAWTGIAVTLAAAPVGWGQEKGQPPGKQPQPGSLPKPTHANVAYGTHERHVLDLWLARSEQPTPLAVFIHGGGFIGGDKSQLSPSTLKELLDAGISVAAVNYRLLKHAPLPAAHADCARAIQFLRSRAKDWNLDKTKVGGFGGSAGAQLVMYLAFHDDLADPTSTDPVARESTRLTCVATTGGQVTLDIAWWVKHVPGYDKPHRDVKEIFGTKTEEDALKKNAEIAALSLISEDDPPIFMTYGMAPDEPIPTDSQKARNWKIHHVVHGVELMKLCEKLGVEAELKYPGAKTTYQSNVAFLKAKLLGKKE